jgi:hypothetical protein
VQAFLQASSFRSDVTVFRITFLDCVLEEWSSVDAD